MALMAKLELRQGQQLVMTPQLQQAIRLLQLSNLELNAFVDAELERNPLLEREEGQDDDGGIAPSSEPEQTTERGPDGELDLAKPTTDSVEAFDTDADNVYPDMTPAELASGSEHDLGSWSSMRQSRGMEDGDANLEAFIASETSLKEHLVEQLQLAFADPARRLIGHHLIDHVDDAGYLHADFHAVANKLGAPPALLDEVVSVLQTFDPPGVFARNLKECLALQLKDQNRYDPRIGALIDNLDLLAGHNVAALRKAVNCDMDELADMIGEIKRLNPKPGLRFGSVQVQSVVPDVIVRPASDFGWHVELNTDTLPRVLVNRVYYARVHKGATSSKDKDYLFDCLQNANWLVKSLDQRARTILRVAEEIVRCQDGFLAYGVQHMRPLNLKTVADAIKMHESTVSRVTSNKYIATPRGIFELKYFFTSSIAASGDGEALSSEAVRFRIKQLIDAETCDSVLSDDAIVSLLQGEGVDIARRTVAKYREGMRIASSVQRRRQKRSAAETGLKL